MKNGWQTKKLGDVATLQRGFDLPTQERVSGDVPLVTSSGITDTHNTSAVPGPGVATGRSGSIGNVFFIEDDFWPLNTVLYVKKFHGNDPKFVFHLLKNFDLKRFATGSGVPTLNRNFVHDELVSVPPLSEQRRIVSLLDEAFAGLATSKANAERNLKNARTVFESHLQSVFTRSGKGWVERSVKEIAAPTKGSIRTGPFGSQLLHSEFVDVGIAVLGIDNAVANEFRWGKSRFITREKCLPGYLHMYFLHSPRAREFLAKHAKGAIMAGLNMGLIQELPVVLPSTDVQAAIVKAADALHEETERLASLYERKLVALEALKKSLLHQAFTGGL